MLHKYWYYYTCVRGHGFKRAEYPGLFHWALCPKCKRVAVGTRDVSHGPNVANGKRIRFKAYD